MSSYQKTYQNKIGSASLNIKKAIAGEKVNCRLTYKAGFLGVDDSGGIKVVFRIVSDIGSVQFNDPQADNYIKVTCSNKDVHITPNAKSTGFAGKINVRPWSLGFSLVFTNMFMQDGDELYVDFKNWQIQTFIEKTFEYKVLVDPFATAKFLEVPHSPEIEIVPDKPEKLIIVAPTQVETGKEWKALIKIEDQWGNPCTNVAGVFTLVANEYIKDLPKTVEFKNGKALMAFTMPKESTTYLKVKYNRLTAASNPITAVKKPVFNQYWADLHGQSEETVGTNSIDDYFAFARDYALLDVACPQANDFQISNAYWKKTNTVTKAFTQNNAFVALPGYEWSGNTSNGGDRNVIYRKEGMPLYRSSHALIDESEYDDIATDANTVKELFKKLPEKDAITIAHVGGRFANIDMHDGKIERSVEVHSDWGTFEWLLFDALERKYRVGIVANSDGHTGRPGASYPTQTYFFTYGGLTCILADRLTKDSIFSALYNRHHYATTGVRMFLNVNCLIDGKPAGIMGDIIPVEGTPVLHIDYKGTAPLDRIEVYNKNKIIHTYYPAIDETEEKTIKIIWSGSKIRGRDRNVSWKGNVKIKNNAITALQKVNFYNRKDTLVNDEKSVTLNGTTTGATQGMIITLAKKTGELAIELNGKVFSVPVSEIGQKPLLYPMGGLDARLEIVQTHAGSKPHAASFACEIDKLQSGDNPVFVKVIQKDSHMAWSSPVYLVK